MSGATSSARRHDVFAGMAYERLRVFLQHGQDVDALDDETIYIRPLLSRNESRQGRTVACDPFVVACQMHVRLRRFTREDVEAGVVMCSDKSAVDYGIGYVDEAEASEVEQH